MVAPRWLIYGAYGYSGTLVAEEAVRRGHRPLLAGRSATKLAPLAERLGLEYVAFDLDDLNTITRQLAEIDLVFHAAGPFVHTSAPMLKACVLTGTHYLDITGEFTVFENTFTFDEAARKQGIALISGVGFDVVPSDCLALYVAQQIENPNQLEIAIAGLTGISAGTAKSAIDLGSSGGRVRRDGALKPYMIGAGVRTIRFSQGESSVMPIPWGDLVTAYHSTGIPNITTYMALPRTVITLARFTAPISALLLTLAPIRRLARGLLTVLLRGPDEAQRQTGQALLWARATNASGQSAEAWLETPEAYHLTALAGVRCVERVLAEQPTGALTPAQAFGADFILEIPGTRRLDSL